MSFCENCERCLKGFESDCPDVQLTGYPVYWTFRQCIIAKVTHLIRIPVLIDLIEAVSILSAGTVAYTVTHSLIKLMTAFKQSGVKPGQFTILGARGGLCLVVDDVQKVDIVL
jgi:alcohol dehydrogenase, propanol-preferring